MKKFLLTSGFLFALAAPAFALPLVPCGSEFVPCTPCHLYALADRIVDFLLVQLAAPILVVALLVGGFVWLTSSGNPAQIEKGKKILTSSVLGIFIAFGGWLIVDTIIVTLGTKNEVKVGENVTIGWAWNTIDECPAPVVTQPPTGGGGGGGGITPPAGTFQTEEEGRMFFQNAGIEINKPQCTAAQPTNCTNVKGLPISAAQKLALVAQSGGFCLSGATEGQGTIHQTHGVGLPIVDIKPSCAGPVTSSGLDNLAKRFTAVATQVACEGQSGIPRSANKNCLLSGAGSPFTQSQINQLNHIHIVF